MCINSRVSHAFTRGATETMNETESFKPAFLAVKWFGVCNNLFTFKIRRIARA